MTDVDTGTGDDTNVSPSQYKTKGEVVVAAQRGFSFRPSDTDLPVITSEGVKMTRTQADKVLKEAASTGREDLVHEVKEGE